jgi:hypothetical protein
MSVDRIPVGNAFLGGERVHLPNGLNLESDSSLIKVLSAVGTPNPIFVAFPSFIEIAPL